MHHSDVQYWRHLQSLPPGHEDLPSPRVCRLLYRMFQGWKGRPGWLTENEVGHLFRNRRDLSKQEQEHLAGQPIPIRKAHAICRMLELIVRPDIAEGSSTCNILPDELIVGTLPPFAVGQGKEFVRYLTEDEELAGALDYLNELSPMGHVVPNHQVVLEQGLNNLADEARRRSTAAGCTSKQQHFYEAVALSLEGVIGFAAAYAKLARNTADTLEARDPNRTSLYKVAACLERAPREPAQSFHEALQAIYIVHCALHWTVEIVPIGRLDQLLNPYLKRDLKAGRLTKEHAQELIDCFWIKLDERVILSPRHAENRFTACDGVLTGFWGPSNYDQGGLLNQWMQQVTIGGVLPTDSSTPQDASNDVTRLCLSAARRLPLNSPTLDLRVHSETPKDILRLAARALLSGGAHPVLLNDDIIVPALAKNAGPKIPIRDARNYACDGCYETMVAGASEFSFGFIFALDLIEKTLNRGASLAGSGPIFLRGSKDSWRSKSADDIETWEEFQTILRSHMLLSCHRYVRNLTTLYGNKANIAPSPLLSALISGCIETGRDITEGGARYHIFSPLLIGISNAADSLAVIHDLVFSDTPRFSLAELTSALATDWGNKLVTIDGELTAAFGPFVDKNRIDDIRSLCLAHPKFGNGDKSVDRWAWWLLETFIECVWEAYDSPIHAGARRRLSEAYDTAAAPFVLHLAPGVGTFEQYVFAGSLNGASADGRRARGPIASDLSAAPIPDDKPAGRLESGTLTHARRFNLKDSLGSFKHRVMKQLGDGAPVDYNIPENFPIDELVKFLRSFADGAGGSICTFTVANPETFLAAQQRPDDFNLVRVRMGGWTEFFITLFPDHQEQHKRRPLYE